MAWLCVYSEKCPSYLTITTITTIITITNFTLQLHLYSYYVLLLLLLHPHGVNSTLRILGQPKAIIFRASPLDTVLI